MGLSIWHKVMLHGHWSSYHLVRSSKSSNILDLCEMGHNTAVGTILLGTAGGAVSHPYAYVGEPFQKELKHAT